MGKIMVKGLDYLFTFEHTCYITLLLCNCEFTGTLLLEKEREDEKELG